jgi:hypothetical protein
VTLTFEIQPTAKEEEVYLVRIEAAGGKHYAHTFTTVDDLHDAILHRARELGVTEVALQARPSIPGYGHVLADAWGDRLVELGDRLKASGCTITE